MKNTQSVIGRNQIKVESVKIEWLPDSDPDLSWLDQSDADMGEGFEAQSAERKASYGSSWEMIGCVAKAFVSYPMGGGARRIETLTSGGLWGIESDSDKSYLAELAEHLNTFGIETTTAELLAVKEVA